MALRASPSRTDPADWRLPAEAADIVAHVDRVRDGLDAEEPGDPFVARERELGALRAMLQNTRSRRPRVVVVEGPPGIGKTALVDRFLLGEGDVQVLRASGERWEALVAYGVVDQLMRVARVSGVHLLATRERALPADEPGGVGAHILTLLGNLEAKGPVALVIDDTQWADTDSLRALLFALRRLVAERVLALLIVRPGDASRLPDGLRRLADGNAGSTLRVGPLTQSEVRALARAMGVGDFSSRLAQRLHTHTQGNPSYVRALLTELPAEWWQREDRVLPAPRAVVESATRRLDACSPEARRLIEAASVLGVDAPLATAGALGGVQDPLAALEEAGVAGLLQAGDEPGIRQVMFPHPVMRAAIYNGLGPALRVRLHRAAAELVDDDGAALHHRVAAADPPDAQLAADLESFARQQDAAGAWADAASALVEGSRMSAAREQREQRLLHAVNTLASAGDLARADAFAREVVEFAPGPLRDATLGYLAILRGRPAEAHDLLASAWRCCDPAQHGGLAALIAQRWALHSVGRLRGAEIVEWVRRSVALAGPDEALRVAAEALLVLGLAWQGRSAEGAAVHGATLACVEAGQSTLATLVKIACGAVRLAVDDLAAARSELSDATRVGERVGSVWIAVWAYVWLSRVDYSLGGWDEAAVAAERAVSLLEESGHEWLRPLARWAAVGVPAARGEWQAAEEHARLAAAQGGDYELMVAAAGLARAQVAVARGDHEAVLRAFEPVLAIRPREGIDEPGFWPWPDLYGDALVGSGRLEQAEAFLAPHEELAAARGRRSSIARLARVRGRLEAAAGRVEAAEAAFRHGLGQLERLPLPFERALLELAYGQTLRRHGQRRAAAGQLQAAYDRLAALAARPYLQRCERELNACGLAPAKRHSFDPSQLTAQELAVARLVAAGMSNRQVASELFVSIKTVQFHLTHIYSKLRVSSRAELAAHLKDQIETATRPARS